MRNTPHPFWHSLRINPEYTDASFGINPNRLEEHRKLGEMKGGISDMLWIAIAASLFLVALFLYFRFRDVAKKIERDIFF